MNTLTVSELIDIDPTLIDDEGNIDEQRLQQLKKTIEDGMYFSKD